jgi:hypothetical protein
MVKNRRKHFALKKMSEKSFWRKKNVTDFFQILDYKKILILKMNIFLDFSFSKKQ